MVCTANICRSPMFGAFMRRDLLVQEAPFDVTTAGLLDWDQPADAAAVTAMAGYGVDISGHRSRPVAALDLTSFDLILTMTREHLRELVIAEPTVFPVTFTVKAFARALDAPAGAGGSGALAERIREISTSRTMASMMWHSIEDDVADPHRFGQQEFDATAGELADLSEVIVRNICSLAI